MQHFIVLEEVPDVGVHITTYYMQPNINAAGQEEPPLADLVNFLVKAANVYISTQGMSPEQQQAFVGAAVKPKPTLN